MREDRLSRAALIRLQELGLPLYLLDIDNVREKFLREGWVLLVHDRANLTEVDLFHPEQGRTALGRSCDL